MAVPGIGLVNTVRFGWREKEAEPFGREEFGRTLLMGVLKLGVEDVFCLQENQAERAYEVTLHTEKKHEEVMRMVRALEKERPMSHYEVKNLAKNNYRIVTVRMYNPFVKEEDIRAYLGRYMENISSARLMKDTLGFWDGRRSFQVLLREDTGGMGGYLHPPAMFSLGADRGTLYYARQPPYCRRCMAYGHTLASCGERKCRYCGSGEHEARDCGEPKKCHGCGSVEHLWRDCQARRRSYASAAGGGARAGDGGRRGEERAEGGGREEGTVPKESEGTEGEGGGREGGTATKEPEKEKEKEEERAGTEGVVAETERVVDGTDGVVDGTEGVVAGTEGEVAGEAGIEGVEAGTEGGEAGTEGGVAGSEGVVDGTEGEERKEAEVEELEMEVETEGKERKEAEGEDLDMGKKDEVLRMIRERIEKKGPVKGWREGEFERVKREFEKVVREKFLSGDQEGRTGTEGEVEGEEEGKGGKRKGKGIEEGRVEERREEERKRVVFGRMREMERGRSTMESWGKKETSRNLERGRMEVRMMGEKEFRTELDRYDKYFEEQLREQGLYMERDRAREQKKKKKKKGEPVGSGRGRDGGEGRGEGEVAGPSGVSSFLSTFSSLPPMEEQE